MGFGAAQHAIVPYNTIDFYTHFQDVFLRTQGTPHGIAQHHLSRFLPCQTRFRSLSCGVLAHKAQAPEVDTCLHCRCVP